MVRPANPEVIGLKIETLAKSGLGERGGWRHPFQQGVRFRLPPKVVESWLGAHYHPWFDRGEVRKASLCVSSTERGRESVIKIALQGGDSRSVRLTVSMPHNKQATYTYREVRHAGLYSTWHEDDMRSFDAEVFSAMLGLVRPDPRPH